MVQKNKEKHRVLFIVVQKYMSCIAIGDGATCGTSGCWTSPAQTASCDSQSGDFCESCFMNVADTAGCVNPPGAIPTGRKCYSYNAYNVIPGVVPDNNAASYLHRSIAKSPTSASASTPTILNAGGATTATAVGHLSVVPLKRDDPSQLATCIAACDSRGDDCVGVTLLQAPTSVSDASNDSNDSSCSAAAGCSTPGCCNPTCVLWGGNSISATQYNPSNLTSCPANICGNVTTAIKQNVSSSRSIPWGPIRYSTASSVGTKKNCLYFSGKDSKTTTTPAGYLYPDVMPLSSVSTAYSTTPNVDGIDDCWAMCMNDNAVCAGITFHSALGSLSANNNNNKNVCKLYDGSLVAHNTVNDSKSTKDNTVVASTVNTASADSTLIVRNNCTTSCDLTAAGGATNLCALSTCTCGGHGGGPVGPCPAQTPHCDSSGGTGTCICISDAECNDAFNSATSGGSASSPTLLSQQQWQCVSGSCVLVPASSKQKGLPWYAWVGIGLGVLVLLLGCYYYATKVHGNGGGGINGLNSPVESPLPLSPLQ